MSLLFSYEKASNVKPSDKFPPSSPLFCQLFLYRFLFSVLTLLPFYVCHLFSSVSSFILLFFSSSLDIFSGVSVKNHFPVWGHSLRGGALRTYSLETELPRSKYRRFFAPELFIFFNTLAVTSSQRLFIRIHIDLLHILLFDIWLGHVCDESYGEVVICEYVWTKWWNSKFPLYIYNTWWNNLVNFG
jgi:hypothetical protein